MDDVGVVEERRRLLRLLWPPATYASVTGISPNKEATRPLLPPTSPSELRLELHVAITPLLNSSHQEICYAALLSHHERKKSAVFTLLMMMEDILLSPSLRRKKLPEDLLPRCNPTSHINEDPDA